MGTTVLLTTQYLEEADQLASGISVIDAGRVVASGSPDELTSRLGGDRIDIVVRHAADLAAAASLVRLRLGAEATVDGDTRLVSAPVTDRVTALTEIVRSLHAAGITAEDVALRRPTLDEVFLHLTAHRTSPATGPTADDPRNDHPGNDDPGVMMEVGA